jgi:hypothetical protein
MEVKCTNLTDSQRRKYVRDSISAGMLVNPGVKLRVHEAIDPQEPSLK